MANILKLIDPETGELLAVTIEEQAEEGRSALTFSVPSQISELFDGSALRAAVLSGAQAMIDSTPLMPALQEMVRKLSVLASLPLPASWTDAVAAEAQIRATLGLAAGGEPRDFTRGAMERALCDLADDEADDEDAEPDAVAREVLERAAGGDEWDRLIRRWAEELAPPAAGLLTALFPDDDDDDDDDKARRWVERFAEWLERQAEPAEAAELRDLAAQEDLPGVESKRLITMLNAVDVLARLTWTWTVRAWWEEERRRRRRRLPALTLPFTEDLFRTHAPGARVVATAEGNAELLDRDGRPIAPLRYVGARPENVLAAVPIEAVSVLARRGIGLLGTLTAHRLFRWVAVTTNDRFLDMIPDARVLVVDGAFDAMAELTGGDRKILPAIVAAAAHLYWPSPGGTGGGTLWAYTHRPAHGQRRGRVEMTVGTMMRPYYGFDVKGNALPGDRGALVPLLPLPPLIGGRQTHGSQAALQLAVLAELRKRAVELVDGGARISEVQWRALAERVGMSTALLARVLDRWVQDGDDAPALLRRDGDRWTLADAHAEARAFMELAGRGAKAASKGGTRKAERAARRRGEK